MKLQRLYSLALILPLAFAPFFNYPIAQAITITQANPQNPEMMKYLKAGADQIKESKFQEAIEPLKKALELKPDVTNQAITHYLLGVAYSGLDKKDEAVAEYKESVTLKPDFTNGHFALAKLYFATGRFEEAVTTYKDITKLDAKSVNGFFGLGASYLSLKHFQEAIEPLQQAVKLQPTLAEGHYYLGQIYVQLAKKDDATKECEILKTLNSPLATQLAAQIEMFSSAKEVEPGGRKVPGRVFIGIGPIRNASGIAMPINEMRAQISRRILQAYFDCVLLDGNKPEQVVANAKDRSCDYIVYVEILGGFDEQPQTGGVTQQTTQLKIKLKLIVPGNEKPEFETTLLSRESREASGNFVGVGTVDSAVREMLDELRKRAK